MSKEVSKEMIISSTRHETRVAILEDGQLVEIYFQRGNEYSLAGSIHKGRVTRVLPGMQSAFVDIGLERDAFLYVSDFFEEEEDYERISGGEERPRKGGRASVPPVATEEEAQPEVKTAAVTASVERAELSAERPARRSRRRRGRGGRGFPESKYAALAGGDGERVNGEVAEEDSRGEGEVILLPGESLAKYRELLTSQSAAEESTASREQTDEGVSEQAVTGSDGALSSETEGEAEKPTAAETGAPAVGAAFPEASYLAIEAEMTTSVIATRSEREKDLQEGRSSAEPESLEHGAAENYVGAAAEETGDERATAPAAEEVAGEAVEGEEEEEQEQEEEEEEIAVATDEKMAGLVREESPLYPLRERPTHRLSRRMRRRLRAQQKGTGEARGPQGGGGLETARDERRAAEEHKRADRPQPQITELLKEGQEIIVQIAKEPLGQKGARITSHIALPGRYVVYMPTLDHMGVSRKIASDAERQRLKRILQKHHPGATGGYIVRTAGEGRSEQEIAADMEYLYNLWLDIKQKAEKKAAPALLYHDLDLVQRVLRDQLTDSFKAIWVDNEETYETVLRFTQRFQPTLVNRVKLYSRPEPIFDAFGVTPELEKALRPKVWLKSGGYIVINQTEALVAIDINTGKFVGKSNRLEDTIVKTNIEAVHEIARQIRLRDLGGIIVVDFIDMEERKNRQKVMQALEEAMQADRAPYKLLQFNDFGLVAITRKRVKQSLERTLCSPCPTCEGAGYVKSVQTVVSEILTEASKVRHMLEGKNVVLRCHPDVARFLKSNQNTYLEELEEILGRPVVVTGDVTLHPEKFDLA